MIQPETWQAFYKYREQYVYTIDSRADWDEVSIQGHHRAAQWWKKQEIEAEA